MTDAISPEERIRRNEIRDALRNYNIIEPYPDYNNGELERIKNETYRLQRTLEGLIVVLASKNGLDFDDFVNEA